MLYPIIRGLDYLVSTDDYVSTGSNEKELAQIIARGPKRNDKRSIECCTALALNKKKTSLGCVLSWPLHRGTR